MKRCSINIAPAIIKYPFWQMTVENSGAVYACVNLDKAAVPQELAGRSICIREDIGKVLQSLKPEKNFAI